MYSVLFVHRIGLTLGAALAVALFAFANIAVAADLGIDGEWAGYSGGMDGEWVGYSDGIDGEWAGYSGGVDGEWSGMYSYFVDGEPHYTYGVDGELYYTYAVDGEPYYVYGVDGELAYPMTYSESYSYAPAMTHSSSYSYGYSTPFYSYSTPYTKVTTAPVKPIPSYPPHKPVQYPIPPTPPQPAPAPYCTIIATPSTITSGQSSVLVWNSSNALSASLSGFGSVSTSGTRTVSPASVTTYTLTVFGTNGQMVNCQTTVNVTGGPYVPPTPPQPAPAPYCSISITPSYNYGSLYQYHYNQAATLTWSSYGATSATISGLGSVSLSGSQTVYPSYNQVYTMTVSGPGGTANCQTSYHQPPLIYPPVYPQDLYCTLTANPAYIQNGQTSVLSWTSTGATSAWLSDGLGNVHPNGSLIVRPESTRYYTLTVSNGYATKTCSITLTVSGVAPYVSLTQIPYTGFDFGPIGNTMYWLALAGLALSAGYFIVFYLPKQAGLTLALPAIPHFSRKVLTKIPNHASAMNVVASKMSESVESVAGQGKEQFSGDTMVLARSKDGSMPRIIINRS